LNSWKRNLAGFAVHRPALMAVHDVLLSEKERLAGASRAGLTEKPAVSRAGFQRLRKKVSGPV